MNILISEAGGPAAMGIIKSLWQCKGYGNIVTIDANKLSCGHGFSDKQYQVPMADDKNYWDSVYNVILKEDIGLIIPTSENDLKIFADNKEELDELGVILYMSDSEAIETCLDKWKFYNKCKDNFPLPKTFKGTWGDLKGDIFAKPVRGKGSVGCKKIFVNELTHGTKVSGHEFKDDEIYSEYLPGREYTIDVLCDLNSKVLSVIPRVRLETKAGISTKGQLFHNDFIENTCRALCEFLNLKGPVCIQMKDDENGIPHIIEVNPRSGGGSYFATMAGVNFAEIIVRLLKGEDVEIPDFEELCIVRYYEEVAL